MTSSTRNAVPRTEKLASAAQSFSSLGTLPRGAPSYRSASEVMVMWALIAARAPKAVEHVIAMKAHSHSVKKMVTPTA